MILVFGSGLGGKIRLLCDKDEYECIFRKSNDNERKAAMKTGLKFIEMNQLSRKTKVTKVFMGGEPEEFKSLFIEW